MLALLFNWYRHQIALKNNIANFKPVILFRSKFIEESKKDYKKFNKFIPIVIMEGLNPEYINKCTEMGISNFVMTSAILNPENADKITLLFKKMIKEKK